MPAKSAAQQRFMGMEYAKAKAGKKTDVKMSKSQLKDFAATPLKGLPKRVGRGEKEGGKAEERRESKAKEAREVRAGIDKKVGRGEACNIMHKKRVGRGEAAGMGMPSQQPPDPSWNYDPMTGKPLKPGMMPQQQGAMGQPNLGIGEQMMRPPGVPPQMPPRPMPQGPGAVMQQPTLMGRPAPSVGAMMGQPGGMPTSQPRPPMGRPGGGRPRMQPTPGVPGGGRTPQRPPRTKPAQKKISGAAGVGESKRTGKGESRKK